MRSTVKYFSVLIAVLAMNTMASGQTVKKWKIDKSHASVNFSVDHFFSAVTGKFKSFDGEIYFDPEDLEGSRVSFRVEIKSVDTGEDDRDADLQSESFFNAEKWPLMKFASSKFEKVSDKDYKVYGKLTIRDVTKDVALPLKIKGVMDNPWKDGYVIMGIAVKTVINRTEYGVGTGSWAATAVVGDEVSVSVNMELDGEK